MNTTREYLQMNWEMLKPKIRKHWGKITEDDLSRLNGNSEELINVLRKRYGYGKAQSEIELRNWLLNQGEQSE